jgi:hypothetical protein
MSDEKAERRRRAEKRFQGSLLMAGGGILALLCGLCTIVVGSEARNLGNVRGGGLMAVLPPMLFFGGIPMAVGVAIFLRGLSIYHERGKPKSL